MMPGEVAEMMPIPMALILLVGLFEVIGGLLVLWGAFGPDWATRLGGFLIAPVMLGAIFMVHMKNGWDMMKGGMEFQALLLVVALLFVLKGNSISQVVVGAQIPSDASA